VTVLADALADDLGNITGLVAEGIALD